MSFSIAIPTYNKPKILIENLSHYAIFLQRINVDIYIYDDSDTETSGLLLEEYILEKNMQNIHYIKTTNNHGHDYNIQRSIFNTPGDYVFLLGDGLFLEHEQLEEIIAITYKENFDAILLHSSNGYNNEVLNDIVKVYEKFSRHSTLTGGTIFSRKIIEIARKKDLSKYEGLQFMQFAIFYEGFDNNSCKILNIGGKSVYRNLKKGDGYACSQHYEIFCKNWYLINKLLPNIYTDESKIKSITHMDIEGKYSSSLLRLLKYRSLDYINKEKYNLNKFYIDECIVGDKKKMLFFLNIPRGILLPLYKILNYIQKKKIMLESRLKI